MTALRSHLAADMVEVLGHELRNPLASVVAGVSLVHEMTDEGDPRSQHLQQALTDLARVSTLLTSYLEFGRSGEFSMNPLNLTELVHVVAARYGPGTVHVEDPAEAVPVRGDAAMLERMLENLIDNAFAVGASHVDVLVTASDDRCKLEVRDDGPGVNPAVRDRIFRPFVSGHGSSGLGLTIVHEILEAHGGDIALVAAERGARFRICLPACR